MDNTDILIAGGGIAGLSAAARLGTDGHRVTLVDPAPPVISGHGDLRTTAFFQPAIATLDHAGAWQGMADAGAPLRVMRIIDAGGVAREVRETADFTPQSTGHDVFGWNIPNVAARESLLARLAEIPSVRLLHSARVEGWVSRLDHAIVRLSDGTSLSARLVVAADGRDSTLRELAGLPWRRWDYGQSALVFAVTHPNPHDGVSTEIHRTGGPLTLVPMPDQEGRPSSSVVWLVPSARVAELMALDDAELGAVLTGETMDLYGPLEIAGPRAVWPMISQVALRLTARRLVLVAETAHVMPPIGAQGLNTSLHDIETLARLVDGADDPGADDLLATYQRRILPRTLARVAGIDLLNRAAQAEAQPIRDLRRLGLSAISHVPFLNRLAVRAGMGI